MAAFGIVILLSAISVIIAEPMCEPYGEQEKDVRCTAGAEDYVLKKGLVSDNNLTTSLTLKDCRITAIQLESFHGLSKLKYLDLSVNKIEILTPGVFEGASRLTHLHLANNLLEELPNGLFDNIPRLELLNLKGNKIDSFGATVFHPLTRLGHLDLSTNSFEGRYMDPNLFDRNVPIAFMDFSGSPMSNTPSTLLHSFEIISLLNLAGCSLNFVPEFATARNLKSMKHLILSWNALTKLENGSFTNLENLEILDLSHNKIESFDENVFKWLIKLKTIILDNNKIKVIPDTSFQSMCHLGTLDLSHNEIESVSVEALRGASVEVLNLSNNKLAYLPPDFCMILRSCGARLLKFYFNNNPWKCGCLRELLAEVKTLDIEYNSADFDGKQSTCVATGGFRCKRLGLPGRSDANFTTENNVA